MVNYFYSQNCTKDLSSESRISRKVLSKEPLVKPSDDVKIPPQAAYVRFLATAPSVFTFSQDEIEGAQITSLMEGALGGWIFIFKALRILNYVMSTADVFFV